MGQLDINRLWQNFLDTVTNHYADFSGRVGRPQFWYYVLVEVVVGIGLAIAQSILWTHLLTSAFSLAMLLPNAGMGARRLQDTSRSGALVWLVIIPSAIMQIFAFLGALGGIFGAVGFLAFYFTIGWLISLITLVAAIFLIYFWTQPGQPEANQYGPVPPVWSPGAAPTVT